MAGKEDTPMATVVSSPAATVALKKTVKSTKPVHPSTVDMVFTAIAALKERNGSSLQAIKKYIAGTYTLDADKLAPLIRKHIKAAVLSGALVQTKGKGASGSFKLPNGKAYDAKKKKMMTISAVAKKAAAPKKLENAKKSSSGKKPESAAKKANKTVAAKKPTTKKSNSAEKIKKAPSAKATATKMAKSPSKVKKVSKAPTTKPKAPKPKTIATPKSTMKKAAVAKK